MNITYTNFQYDFNALKNEILYYVKDGKKIDTFIEFISNNILYGAFSYKPIIKSDFDFAISSKVIRMLEDKLEGDKLFNTETEQTLNDKEFVGVNVDNCSFNTYESFCEDTFELNDIKVQLYPTFPLFDLYSEKLDVLFSDIEGYEDFRWGLYETVEKFDRFYIDKYLEHNDYQFGGNLVHAIQGEYRNLIGVFEGGWGDCGAVYVFVSNGSIVSTVDMY